MEKLMLIEPTNRSNVVVYYFYVVATDNEGKRMSFGKVNGAFENVRCGGSFNLENCTVKTGTTLMYTSDAPPDHEIGCMYQLSATFDSYALALEEYEKNSTWCGM